MGKVLTTRPAALQLQSDTLSTLNGDAAYRKYLKEHNEGSAKWRYKKTSKNLNAD